MSVSIISASPIGNVKNNIKQSIYTRKNINKVSDMLQSTGFYTEGKKHGSNGSFRVEAYQQYYNFDASKHKYASFHQDELTKEPVIIVDYKADYGKLTTWIQDRKDKDVCYKVNQEVQKRPSIDVFYKGMQVDENGLIEPDKMETFTPLQEQMGRINDKKLQIYKALGKFLPKISDLKTIRPYLP